MAKLKNFTPVPDSLVKEYGLITAAVWGRVWRYAQMDSGKCLATHEKLSEGLNIGRRTLIRHLSALIENGYIIDHTPDLRNKPHELTTTRKARIEIIIEAVDEGVPESHSGVSQSHSSVPEWHSESARESHEDTNKKQTKRRKSKAADTRLEHPSILAYRTNARLTPPIIWRDDIIQTVGEKIEPWGDLVKEWIGKGWRPDNVAGMLDAFKKQYGKQTTEKKFQRVIFPDGTIQEVET